MKLPLSAPRLGLAVAMLAGASALVASATASSGNAPTPVSQTSSSDDGPGDISGPCDEAEHANDPRCTGTGTAQPGGPASTATTMPTAPAPAPTGSDTRTVNAGAGTVVYRVDNGTLTLVSATPNAGWVVEVEQSAGREVELDFRSGTRRVQVNLEFEDGQVRERVRARDDATDSDVRIENGVVVRQDNGDDHGGDRHGGDDRGDDNSSPGSSGHDDDNSGSGSSGSGSSGSHG